MVPGHTEGETADTGAQVDRALPEGATAAAAEHVEADEAFTVTDWEHTPQAHA